jgi:leucyl/phenylalanyl-tRNA--protein transferase
MVSWLTHAGAFDPERADEHGLVALGGALDPDLLLAAYSAGVFPWSSDPVVTWWSPDPRAIFELDRFKLHRTVRRSASRGQWRFSVDEDFSAVIRACAEAAPGRLETWITPDFIAAYEQLHRRGYAHSVEVYEGAELVGGLYGVTIGAFYGGESMFHRRTDASKAAVGFLVERLRAGGFQLLDAQVPTPHLQSLGAVEIRRSEYLARLRAAIRKPAQLK